MEHHAQTFIVLTMTQRMRCLATTQSGAKCKRPAIPGASYCATHSDLLDKDRLKERKRLRRQDILRILEQRGNAEGLDLSFTDISDVKLGSSITRMPDLDGVVFGVYGAVRSGVRAERTMFQRTSLRHTKFIYAKLAQANFYKSDLSHTDFRYADLSRAILADANVQGANFFEANLDGTNLKNTNLRGADLYQARLSGRTNLRRTNIGDTVLQENLREYSIYVQHMILPHSTNDLEFHLKDRLAKAHSIYEALLIHFQENGFLEDANWAYLRKRRIQKQHYEQLARDAFAAREIRLTLRYGSNWLGDWFVEVLCDYGESTWRVIRAITVLTLVVGPLSISALGGLAWAEGNMSIILPFIWQREWGYVYSHYVLYMLDVLTTANFGKLQPRNDLVRLLSGFLALAGIFLAGLLGFVAGNRIRRS